MVLHFEGKTNGDSVYINAARFILPTGERIVIDRDTTEYTIVDGKLSMDWFGCYVWDGEKRNYDMPTSCVFSNLAGVEIEDDAPEDYELSITNACWSW